MQEDSVISELGHGASVPRIRELVSENHTLGVRNDECRETLFFKNWVTCISSIILYKRSCINGFCGHENALLLWDCFALIFF
jgi:hypothetical protein